MKIVWLALILTAGVQADVLDLGLIDSRKSLLDQRFVLDSTTQDQQQAINIFYESKKIDFVAGLENSNRTQIIDKNDIENEWAKLFEVSHD